VRKMEISEMKEKILKSEPISQVFFSVARGLSKPSDIAKELNKSKHVISMHLSSLEKANLIKEVNNLKHDLRTKNYAVNWDTVAQIFWQDHRLEFVLYENRLFHKPKVKIKKFTSKISKADLVISGDGKLGFMVHFIPEDIKIDEIIDNNMKQKVEEIMTEIFTDFVGLLKIYIKDKQFPTIQSCLLTFYKDLRENYGALKKESELFEFFDWLNKYFPKLFSALWDNYKKVRPSELKIRLRVEVPNEIKEFFEAGFIDSGGSFAVNPEEVKDLLKPGQKAILYPSFTYEVLRPTPKIKRLFDRKMREKF